MINKFLKWLNIKLSGYSKEDLERHEEWRKEELIQREKDRKELKKQRVQELKELKELKVMCLMKQCAKCDKIAERIFEGINLCETHYVDLVSRIVDANLGSNEQ